MRAALDQAVYTIAIAHGVTEQKILRNVAFPFSSSAADFQSRLNGACLNFPRAILTVLESAKPYKGGDHALWAINELANTSKHKTLTTVAFRIIGAYAHERYLERAGTPREITARLSAEIQKAVQVADLKQRFVTLGMEPVANTPEELGPLMRREQERYGQIIRNAGIKIEK